MKNKIISLVLILFMMMVFSPVVHAENKPDGAEWLVDKGENHVWYKIEGTTLTIGGSGEMPDWTNTGTDDNFYQKAPWYGQNITSVIIDEGITRTGEDSFYDGSLLESIIISKSVIEIGNQSFKSCSNLKTIEFNEGLKKIGIGNFDKAKINTLVLPDGLETIEAYSFRSNHLLTKIVFPSSLTTIGANSFVMDTTDNVLKEITSYSVVAPTLENNLFKNVNIDKLIIPIGSDYSSWSIYTKENVSYFYIVTFDTNGGNEIKSVMVEQNNKLVKPTNPIKENYVFDGWYEDEDFRVAFDFNKEITEDITEDITLYAKWREAESFTYKFINGNNPELTIDDIKSFVLKVDGDYSLFESITIGKLDLIKNEDYTVSEGSTVITFTDKGIAKLNTLSKGEYEILVKYSNDKEVKGKLTIKQIDTPAPEIENPKTGDNYTTYIITGILSLIGIIGISFYIRKKLVK